MSLDSPMATAPRRLETGWPTAAPTADAWPRETAPRPSSPLIAPRLGTPPDGTADDRHLAPHRSPATTAATALRPSPLASSPLASAPQQSASLPALLPDFPAEPVRPRDQPAATQTAPLRRRYPSDLTERQWSRVRTQLPSRPDRDVGRPTQLDLREVVNAISYRWETGCSWRMLPHDFPKWESIYAYFRSWQRRGFLRRIREELVRPKRSRTARSAAAEFVAPSDGAVRSPSPFER